MPSSVPPDMVQRVGIASLILLAVAGTLTLAEVGVRAALRGGYFDKPHRYMTSDPVLHHRARPDLSTTVSGTPFSTNSLGLRDREYASPKPSGTFRILMLGDSFTEGGGSRTPSPGAWNARSARADAARTRS